MSKTSAVDPVLSMQGIVKRFPGVKALDNVSLRVMPGEVLSVVGENGAGKSTLVKILGGIEQSDAGKIFFGGQPVTINTVRDSTALGIALIHQELNLAENLDVGANIFLGREPQRFGLIDQHAIQERAEPLLERLGIDCPTTTPLRSLNTGKKQLVEIAKALSAGAKILIMDEPTSSLSRGESLRLFKVIEKLRDQGVSIIYISHRLGEVNQLSDRVTVLRDGCNAGELAKDQINHQNMVRLMVGRDLSSFYPPKRNSPGNISLKVENVRTEVFPGNAINLEIKSGEIVGLAGLVGSGRSELVETIFGARTAKGGRVTVAGQIMPKKWQPQQTIRAGLALVPEDRKRQGLFLDDSVKSNISVTSLSGDAVAGMINFRAERNLAERMIENLHIKTPNLQQQSRFLSGGNQQKVVLAKWIANKPNVLIMDEPTRGVDIGAKEQIYRRMDELARDGVAVLFVSSELEELIGMADRVLVFHEGRLGGELTGDEINEQAIMHMATGSGQTVDVAEKENKKRQIRNGK